MYAIVRHARALFQLLAGAAGCLIFHVPAPAHAAKLAYVKAIDQSHPLADAGRSQLLNAFDGDETTAWCADSRDLRKGLRIAVVFKAAQSVDGVMLSPAAEEGPESKLTAIVDNGTYRAEVNLDSEPSTVEINPALQGTEYAITLKLETPWGVDPDVPKTVCIADMALLQGERTVTRVERTVLRKHTRESERVLGQWAREPLGASEASLTFALDGTWTWSFEPLLEGEPETLHGQYRFRGNRLLMRLGSTGRWADMRFKYEHIIVNINDLEAPAADYDVISLQGAMTPKIRGSYNNARF